MNILENISNYLKKSGIEKEPGIAVAYCWNDEILCYTYFKPEAKESEYIDSFLTIGKAHGIRKLVENRYNIDDIHSFSKKKIEDIHSYFGKTKPDISNNLNNIVFSNNFKFRKPLSESLSKSVSDSIKSHVNDMATQNPDCLQSLNRSLKAYLELGLPKENNITKTEKKEKNNKRCKATAPIVNPSKSRIKRKKQNRRRI